MREDQPPAVVTQWCSTGLSGTPLNVPGRPWVVIDTETTGLDPERDTLREFAVVVVDTDGRLLSEHSWRAGDGAGALAHLATGVEAAVVSGVTVAHNLAFDLAFLRREEATCGAVLASPPRWLCTMQLAAGRRTLSALGQEHGVPAQAPHTARGDARTLAEILVKLVGRAADRGLPTVAGLVVAGLGTTATMPSAPTSVEGDGWNVVLAGLDRVVPVAPITGGQRRTFQEVRTGTIGPGAAPHIGDVSSVTKALQAIGITAIALERLLDEAETSSHRAPDRTSP